MKSKSLPSRKCVFLSVLFLDTSRHMSFFSNNFLTAESFSMKLGRLGSEFSALHRSYLVFIQNTRRTLFGLHFGLASSAPHRQLCSTRAAWTVRVKKTILCTVWHRQSVLEHKHERLLSDTVIPARIHRIPFRSPKLNVLGSGQYWGGGPLGKPVILYPFLFFLTEFSFTIYISLGFCR